MRLILMLLLGLCLVRPCQSQETQADAIEAKAKLWTAINGMENSRASFVTRIGDFYGRVDAEIQAEPQNLAWQALRLKISTALFKLNQCDANMDAAREKHRRCGELLDASARVNTGFPQADALQKVIYYRACIQCANEGVKLLDDIVPVYVIIRDILREVEAALP